MNGNFIQNLPIEFENLKWLQAIWLAGNRFTDFPDVLGKIKYLGCIDLNDNEIKVIDDEVTDFTNLASWGGKFG